MSETDHVPPTDDERQVKTTWAPPSSPPHATADQTVSTQTFGDQVGELAGRLGLGDVEIPFDSPVDAVRWWFAPLVDPLTWRAVGAALAMSVIGPLLFATTAFVLTTTAALTLVVAGFLLVVPAFAVVDGSASIGRRIAGWGSGEPIPRRDLATSGDALVSPITTRLSDGARWSQVLFLLLDVVVAPLFLTASLLPLSVVIGILDFGIDPFSFFFDLVDDGPDVGFIEFLVLLPLLALVARLIQFIAQLRRRYVVALLGPDRESELVERVEELSVQRDQVLEAVATERRRIERNLHDGVQQQIVALGIDIGRARKKLDDDPDGARELLDDARDKVRSSIGELRLIGRGLHPAVLEDRGLDAALSAVVAGSPIPITVEVLPVVDSTGQPVELPSDAAETAYYIANEAITNVLKYSNARVASVRAEPDPGLLPAVRVTIHDDGRGGADETRGSGIAGMRARVEAVDGAFRIDSPAGGPTVVTAVIPLRRERFDAGTLDPAPNTERGDRR